MSKNKAPAFVSAVKSIMEEVIVKNIPESSLRSLEETSQNNDDDNTVIEPHFLSEAGLLLYLKSEDKPIPKVPPSTPKQFISDWFVTILPKLPESLKDIEIPCVRECGIRDSIDILSKYFNCGDHRYSLVQFWFLDVLVDCIWRAQDEFRFGISEQKLLLEWIVFVLKLITSDNMTKTLMFTIFGDALSIAEEYVQSGGPNSPTPNTLFTINLENSEVKNNSAESLQSSQLLSTKSSKTSQLEHPKQLIVIKYQDDFQVFNLSNKKYKLRECLSSSIDPPSEEEYRNEEPEESFTSKQEITSESSIEFYKSKLGTPSRFKSLSDNNIPNHDFETTEPKNEEEKDTSIREWVTIPRKQMIQNCPGKIMIAKSEVPEVELRVTSGSPKASFFEEHQKITFFEEKKSSEEHIKKSMENLKENVLDNEEIFKIYYDYNMWQLKNQYMADPNIGWTPSLTSYKNMKNAQNKKGSQNKMSQRILDTKNKTHYEEIEKNIFVNSCVLMAVKQIVFEYFDYNFSFQLARLSLQYPQYLITQEINTNWNIPKDIKGDLKKPMPRKPKKQKVKKEKKDKKEKKGKKEKKDKKEKQKEKEKTSKGKKDESSKKSKSTKSAQGKEKEKKVKGKKSKIEKKEKSSKKSAKSPKISKEEKKEMDRLRKEEEDIRRRQLKEEENKMFMFPLTEAVDDNFFLKIFPDYKPKKGRKSDKGDNDGKRSKSSKSSKSPKSSKSSKSSKKGKKKIKK